MRWSGAMSWQRQLHFFTGKGGVGKSVVACASAVAFVQQRHRVLLIQVNARDSHTRLLGMAPVTSEIRKVTDTLSVVNIDPAEAMKEYALQTLKLESVYRAVFENRATKAFLRFLPSMNELTMMGKIWFHAEEDHGKRYDRIVVDCPATGHALRLLQVAQVLHKAVPVGPLADKTLAMSTLFANPQRAAVHVIATPSELPVNEAIELRDRLRRDALAPLGSLIINQRRASLFHSDDHRRIGDLKSSLPASAAVAELRIAADLEEAAQQQRVASEQPVTCPLLEGPLQRQHIERLASVLLSQMGAP
jgi:anion-transporting  ArsA/GET3 family ATPase